MVQRSPLGETLGRERLVHSLQHAVEEYRRRFGDAPARQG